MEPEDVGEDEFGFSRNYFLAKELGTSAKKSGRKLTDIDLLDEQELREAVANIEPKHEKEIDELIKSYKSLYQEWVLELRCGFGLLMYGFGSKRTLLEDFASTSLTEYSVVVINGYLESVNLKQRGASDARENVRDMEKLLLSRLRGRFVSYGVKGPGPDLGCAFRTSTSLMVPKVVITLAELLWEQLKTLHKTTSGSSHKSQQPFNVRSMDDLLTFLDGPHQEDGECFVCVVVHNIDGPGLRDPDVQQYLARIAACSHVRIVASIDHVNALLLWDKKMVHTQFNWYWHHVPTFAPYKVEGMFLPLVLAQGGSSQSVKTASIVLQSLTPNAQSVFRVLAEYQLAHPDEEGMPMNNLYTICRERFLASSQVTLNSHLTEFKDHELVKTRRDADGQDCLFIPISKEALGKILQDISQ